MGIDGRIYPRFRMPEKSGHAAGELDFMDVWHPPQVKQKDKTGHPDIDRFGAVIMRADRTTSFLIGFGFTKDAMPGD
jgi:hypothetical protein